MQATLWAWLVPPSGLVGYASYASMCWWMCVWHKEAATGGEKRVHERELGGGAAGKARQVVVLRWQRVRQRGRLQHLELREHLEHRGDVEPHPIRVLHETPHSTQHNPPPHALSVSILCGTASAPCLLPDVKPFVESQQ
jgi:hypothetical protein